MQYPAELSAIAPPFHIVDVFAERSYAVNQLTVARQRENDLSARFFFEAHGVREDPATGNEAAFLGAHHSGGDRQSGQIT